MTRHYLPHTPPNFIPPGVPFFITVCAAPRGRNQLATAPVWELMRASAAHYHANGRWHMSILLAMPDHVHLLASFPVTERMDAVVAAWKHYVARHAGVAWQRDFFDHRLRSHEDADEKSAYIRLNPVRANLVARGEDWPYLWVPSDRVALPV